MEMEIPQKFYKLSSILWLQNYDYFYYMCIALKSFIASTKVKISATFWMCVVSTTKS